MSTSPPLAARDPSIGAVHGKPSVLTLCTGSFPITPEIGYVLSRQVIAWPRLVLHPADATTRARPQDCICHAHVGDGPGRSTERLRITLGI